MSDQSKKRGTRKGIAGMWDSLAPPPPLPATELPPREPPADESAAPQTGGSDADEHAVVKDVLEPASNTIRPRGRPPLAEPKARTTINVSPRTLQLLETMRYQARMRGQRSATYSDLLDEAVEVLAQQRNITLPDA